MLANDETQDLEGAWNRDTDPSKFKFAVIVDHVSSKHLQRPPGVSACFKKFVS